MRTKLTKEKSRRKRRGNINDANPLEDLENKYRMAKASLKYKMKKAKNEAWKELVASVQEDPWGLPYKVVLNKLKKACSHRITTRRSGYRADRVTLSRWTGLTPQPSNN